MPYYSVSSCSVESHILILVSDPNGRDIPVDYFFSSPMDLMDLMGGWMVHGAGARCGKSVAGGLARLKSGVVNDGWMV